MTQQFETGLSLRREQNRQSSTFVALCDGDGWQSVAVGMIHQHHPLQPQQSLLLQMHRSTNLKSSTLAKEIKEDNEEANLCEAVRRGCLARRFTKGPPCAGGTRHCSLIALSNKSPALLQLSITLPLQWCNIGLAYQVLDVGFGEIGGHFTSNKTWTGHGKTPCMTYA